MLRLCAFLSAVVAAASAADAAPQEITWLYASSLSEGAAFLGGAMGLREVTGLLQKDSCRIFHVTDTTAYLGVCDSRPAPTCEDGGPEGAGALPVTYTLVVNTHAAVDAWHVRLRRSARVNATAPEASDKFACYAFNFYDVDRSSGLGCYRFEVQAFDDGAWPAGTPEGASAGNGALELPPAPQQITWIYAASLAKGAAFVGEVLGYTEVKGLKQKDSCRIFYATAPVSFLGVCDSRPAPACPAGPEGAAAVPLTYTLVVPTHAAVDDWQARLLPFNGTRASVEAPGASAKFACYAFNMYDADRAGGIGCYRLEVQAFDDPAWPQRV